MRLWHLLKERSPVTARGLIVLLLAVWLTVGFALPLSDLSASVAAITFLLVLLATFLLGLGSFLFSRTRIEAEHRVLGVDEDRLSRTEIPFELSLQGVRLAPLVTARIRRDFEQQGVQQANIRLFGKPEEQSKRWKIRDSLLFPTRGLWQLNGFEIRIEDIFGLFSFRRYLPYQQTIEIQAADLAVQPLPVPATSVQSGDELPDRNERAGDPFDIKAYDPSDGTKRILWKAYARSRELVVRRAEPSVSPQGQLLIYAIAAADEDFVAGALQNYAGFLERTEINIVVGTDATAGSATGLLVTRDSSKVAALLTETALEDGAGSGSGFESFVADSLERFPNSRGLLVFISEARYFSLDSHILKTTTHKTPEELETIASGNNLEITFILVPEPQRPGSIKKEKQLRAGRSSSDRSFPLRKAKRNASREQASKQRSARLKENTIQAKLL